MPFIPSPQAPKPAPFASSPATAAPSVSSAIKHKPKPFIPSAPQAKPGPVAAVKPIPALSTAKSQGGAAKTQAAAETAIEERIRELGVQLAALDKERADLAASGERLAARRERLAAPLSGSEAELVKVLWTGTASRLGAAATASTDWDEQDRTFAWLAATARRVSNDATGSFAPTPEEAELESRLDALAARTRELDAKALGAREQLGILRARLAKALAGTHGGVLELGPDLAKLARSEASLGVDWLGGLESARGRLPAPVSGGGARSAGAFGGLVYPARADMPVTCIHSGVALYDGPVAGLGRVLVVDHGLGYFSVYGFPGRSEAVPGKTLRAGDVLGKAGESKRNSGGGVYFALRFHEKAINPEQWLAAGP